MNAAQANSGRPETPVESFDHFLQYCTGADSYRWIPDPDARLTYQHLLEVADAIDRGAITVRYPEECL